MLFTLSANSDSVTSCFGFVSCSCFMSAMWSPVLVMWSCHAFPCLMCHVLLAAAIPESSAKMVTTTPEPSANISTATPESAAPCQASRGDSTPWVHSRTVWREFVTLCHVISFHLFYLYSRNKHYRSWPLCFTKQKMKSKIPM